MKEKAKFQDLSSIEPLLNSQNDSESPLLLAFPAQLKLTP
jgi:hypothetical protein